MAATLHLIIVTPERQLFAGDVESLRLPSTRGEIGILPGHMPLVTSLVEGVLIIQQGSESHEFALHGGVAQITGKDVVILADSAERAEDIDENRAAAARQRAAQALQASGLTPEERQRLETRLQRAETRLKIAQHRSPTADLPKYQKE